MSMRKLLYIAIILSCAGAVWAARDAGDEADRRARSLRLLESRAEAGEAEAAFRLARLIESGAEGFAADTAEAFRLYRLAADSLYPPALNYLGFSYFSGNSVLSADRDTALMLIERAAMLGDVSAAANLGWLLSHDDSGMKPDLDKAEYWLRRAASSGNPMPLAALADISMQRGDTARADALLDSAARAGYAPAATRLLEMRSERYTTMPADSLMREALHYYHGGAPALAAPLFIRISVCGDAPVADRAYATAVVAQMRSLGFILPYDYDGALRMFWHAAQLGDPSAQYIVAETLDMLPDAFASVEDASDIAFSLTADQWRGKAAEGGVTDSHSAVRRLLP